MKKIVSGHAGSALMRDEVHAARILEATVKAVDIPVTLKMRLGWDDASRNAPGEHRGPGVQGEAGDPGELAVGGAGQLLLDGHEGQPPGLEALDGDELEQVPRAVQGRPAAMGDRTVDQADGRVPADGPPVRDGADPAARLAVVVDGQRQVDPLGELVKGPAWFLHAPMMTVSYDSVNQPRWRRRRRCRGSGRSTGRSCRRR